MERYYVDGRHKNTTSMWVGWNSNLFPRDHETQKIWYLPQISMSPTSQAVVVETLKKSLRIVAEYEKQGIVVTYDLVIAKTAHQIQSEEKPKFDSIL